MSDDRKFETWAILEIMGHVRLAGLVTEQTIAGSAFIRIDVPECGNTPGFTRFFGASSVSLSPVTEEVARSVAARCDTRPVSEYNLVVFNANDYVRVQLTDLGRKIHREHYRKLMANLPPQASFKYELKEDADGWSKFQLWELMKLYGEHMGMCKPLVFEMNIQIELAAKGE